jgi:hypothetical protein
MGAYKDVTCRNCGTVGTLEDVRPTLPMLWMMPFGVKCTACGQTEGTYSFLGRNMISVQPLDRGKNITGSLGARGVCD